LFVSAMYIHPTKTNMPNTAPLLTIVLIAFYSLTQESGKCHDRLPPTIRPRSEHDDGDLGDDVFVINPLTDSVISMHD